jgi:hypothetical protein
MSQVERRTRRAFIGARVPTRRGTSGWPEVPPESRWSSTTIVRSLRPKLEWRPSRRRDARGEAGSVPGRWWHQRALKRQFAKSPTTTQAGVRTVRVEREGRRCRRREERAAVQTNRRFLIVDDSPSSAVACCRGAESPRRFARRQGERWPPPECHTRGWIEPRATRQSFPVALSCSRGRGPWP